jgi:serine/threonine-protein kinase
MGGMGEVYRARDTKLGREVALKVVPEAFAQDAQRMTRFQREAQVLASLNHPNIAAIYGLEESGGVRALVMELVEGPTLADRLERGALPLEDALSVARQIAEALEAAHEEGITHRDLKPANVKVTHDGMVKVLDFGLAKAADDSAVPGDPSSSPTLTAAATQAGLIMGTAAYMAPEQARGHAVDRRADIWSFGAVLFEMLSSRRAFEGETTSDVLASVLKSDPDWKALPASTPPAIVRLLHRCLTRDRKERLQAIGEARVVLESPEGIAAADSSAATLPSPRASWRHAAQWGMAGIVLGVLIAGVILKVLTPKAQPHRVRHLSVALPAGVSISDPFFPELALSPDGTDLVFSGKQGDKIQLYQRRLDEIEAKPIAGTEGGAGPFFSPDGASVAFMDETFSGATPAMKKVSLADGRVQSLCTTYQNFTGDWSPDGTIFYSTSHLQGLARVSSTGGNCQDLTTPDRSKGEFTHGLPQVLPSGDSILFTILRGFTTDQAAVAVLSLKTGKWQTVLYNGTNPHYVPGGYLVYAHEGSMMAAPFDLSSLKLTGSPVPVLDDLMTNSEGGAAQFTFARDGMMAYVAGNEAEASRKVVLVDREGKSQVLTQNEGAYEDLDLSPDGRRIAMTIQGAAWHVWIYDIPRGTLTRLTFENDNRDPFWSSDGKHVVYTSYRNGKCGLYWKLADGSGQEEQLLSNADPVTASSFSPDGKELAYFATSEETGSDIWILPLEGDRKPQPFLRTKFNEWFPVFSPDGHWIAYGSDESGRAEIYVRPFPGPGGETQVSTEGGDRAVWSRDGRELFYRNGSKLIAVPIELKPSFKPGTPRLLWEGNYLVTGHYFDVMPGAKQFLFIKEVERPHTATGINVVLNWFDELKHLMAAQKQ